MYKNTVTNDKCVPANIPLSTVCPIHPITPYHGFGSCSTFTSPAFFSAMEDPAFYVSLVGTVPLVVTVPLEVAGLLDAVITVLDTVCSAGDVLESCLTSLFCRMCSSSGLRVGVTGLPTAAAEHYCTSSVVGVPMQFNSEDELSVSIRHYQN